MKIIPAVDLMDGQVVRLYRGDPHQKTTYSDDPVAISKQWEKEGADMLHLVDLDATLGSGNNMDVIREVASCVSIPVQIAGGLRSEQLAVDVAGTADRIVVGTMAFEDRQALMRVSSQTGKSRIVISVDHSNGRIVTRGWQADAGTGLLEAAGSFLSDGFSEFLLTDVGRDGTMQGPDLEFLDKLCQMSGANVIASGGISGSEDIVNVRKKNAAGVILGRALYENVLSIREAKELA